MALALLVTFAGYVWKLDRKTEMLRCMRMSVLFVVAFTVSASVGPATADSGTDSRATTRQIVVEPSVLYQVNKTTFRKDGNDRLRLELDSGVLWRVRGLQLGPSLTAGYNNLSASTAAHGFSIGAGGQLRREVIRQFELELSVGYSIEDLRGAFVGGIGVRKNNVALRLKVRHSNVGDDRAMPFGALPIDRSKKRVNEVYVGIGGSNKILVWGVIGLGALTGLVVGSVVLHCAIDGCSN